MSAKVIDFFEEAGKRKSLAASPPPRELPQLTQMQVKVTVMLDLISSEIKLGRADPACFFVLYGAPWEENPKEMLWSYLALEFTPKELRKGVETIVKDMESRCKKK